MMMMNTLLYLYMILCAILGNCSGRPGYLHGHHHFEYPASIVHPEPLTIAKYVHLPSAVSHQSSTIIHSAPIIKSIVVPPAIVKTVVPIIKTYHTAPIIKTLHYDPLPYHHHYDHGYHHYH